MTSEAHDVCLFTYLHIHEIIVPTRVVYYIAIVLARCPETPDLIPSSSMRS